MILAKQTNVSAALSTAGMGAALTSTGASYVITAAGAADGLAHQITILNNSATDHSAKTVVITGTNEQGNELTETHAMPAGSVSITSVKFFKTVTSIVPSASTGASTFDIGWTAASQAPWVFTNMDIGEAPFNVGIGVTSVSGSPNYSLKYTYDTVGWFTHATITGKTGNFDGGITTPCLALRLDQTVAGTVTMTVIQSAKA